MSTNPAAFTTRLLTAFLQGNGYTLDNCWNDLAPAMQEKLKWGGGEETYHFVYTNLNGDTNDYNRTWDGVIPLLKQRYKEAWGDAMREDLDAVSGLSRRPFKTGGPCHPHWRQEY
jgi:excinuclease ABC subunit A